MDPEIQNHILDNLKDLNTAVGGIAQGQKDMCERFDKIGPWMKTELDKVDKKAEDSKTQIVALQKWQSVTAWKIGSLSAGAGAAITFIAHWLASKLGFKIS